VQAAPEERPRISPNEARESRRSPTILRARALLRAEEAVAGVAAVISHEVVAHICGMRDLVYAPRYIELDLYRRTMHVRRAHAAGFYASLLRCRLNTLVRTRA